MKNWLIQLFLKWLNGLGWIQPTLESTEEPPQQEEAPAPIPPERAPAPIPEEDVWNSKWEQQPIIYYGRVLKKDTNKYLQSPILQTPVDVRAFILDPDQVIKNVVDTRYLQKQSHDETMLAIQRYIVTGEYVSPFSGPQTDSIYAPLTYTGDLDENDTYEFWQFPFETIRSRRGDCEDGAILIASLAVNAGVPPYRIKVAAGDVSNRFHLYPDAPGFDAVPMANWDNAMYPGVSEGGHAYCIYLASDNEWRVIDWCYYEDSTVPVLQKPLAKKGGYGGCYLDTWFTFNSQHSWNQKSIEIEGKLDKIYKLDELIKEAS
jgi:hypothetical protein